MAKLNQILALEKGVKQRVHSAITQLHKAVQKPALMSGFRKVYHRKDENGEQYPAERQKVQFSTPDVIAALTEDLTTLFDLTATKDVANCSATANVLVDDEVLLKDVPATYLLFMEKQLADLHTFFTKMAELDPGADWSKDESTGLYQTEPVETQRTAKLQRPIVLYDATPEHPAQTQLITEDVVVGQWSIVKYSGAIPPGEKKVIVARIDKLLSAVKCAREDANSREVVNQTTGKKVLDYLFGKED